MNSADKVKQLLEEVKTGMGGVFAEDFRRAIWVYGADREADGHRRGKRAIKTQLQEVMDNL